MVDDPSGGGQGMRQLVDRIRVTCAAHGQDSDSQTHATPGRKGG
jgi:hypothetical protein